MLVSTVSYTHLDVYKRQNKKQLKKLYFEHLNAYKNPEIYKSNLATHAINTGHEFPDITNVTLIKHTPHKGTIMNIWENLQIYKHKTQNNLIPCLLYTSL